jgi:hypothetical protein
MDSAGSGPDEDASAHLGMLAAHSVIFMIGLVQLVLCHGSGARQQVLQGRPVNPPAIHSLLAFGRRAQQWSPH